PHRRDQVAQLQVAEHALAVDAAHLFDARARYRLLIGDDGERFISRLREPARNLGSQRAAHRGRVLGSRRQMDLVVVAHEHHAAPLQRLAKLLESSFHAVAVAVGRLLQLADLQRAVGAEEDRLERGGNTGHAAGSRLSTRMGPNRSFCLTRTTDRRISSRSATNVTTASRRSSDSRISSTSSMGPCRSRSMIRSSFSCNVHVLPRTTSGRGGIRASTLLKAATRKSTSSGCSCPPASTGLAGGGNANASCWARSSSSPAISLYARYSSRRWRTSSSQPSSSVSSSVGVSPGSRRMDLSSRRRAAIHRNSTISCGSGISREASSATYASVTFARETLKMSTSSRSTNARRSSRGPSNTGVVTVSALVGSTTPPA